MESPFASSRKRPRSFSQDNPHQLPIPVRELELRQKRLRLDDNHAHPLDSQASVSAGSLLSPPSSNLNYTYQPPQAISDASGFDDNGEGDDSDPEGLYGQEEEVKGLSDQIQISLVKSGLQFERVFLPEGVLDKLLTRDAVLKELLRNSIPYDKALCLVDYIMCGAKKLFAIALLSLDNRKLHAALDEFWKAPVDKFGRPFDDRSLPLDEKKLDDLLERKRRMSGKPVKPAIWRSSVTINRFLTDQWAFLAPTLPPPPGTFVLEVCEQTILPFIDRNEIVDDVGAFGVVYEVTPHPSNITDGRLKGFHIAVKRLKLQHTKDSPERREEELAWKREVSTHHDIAQMNHPHIIDFVAAIRGVVIDNAPAHLLLFRWADQGNLNSFWKNNPTPKVSAQLVQEMMVQFLGLADALDKLHNWKTGSYRHSDIKPDNILSFSTPARAGQMSSDEHPDIGTLKLSDLGLAKYHVEATGYRHQTSAKYTTHRYQAPEAAINGDGARSTRYDIWSMGCVMLEFVIWLLYGSDTLKRFNLQITNKANGSWFTKSGQTAKLHDTVALTMDFMLANDPECRDGTAIGELIKLVRGRLLVVHLGPDRKLKRAETFNGVDSPATEIPSIQVQQVGDGFVKTLPTGRATSEELHEAMKNIVANVERRDNYWFTGEGNRDLILQELRKLFTNTVKPKLRVRTPTMLPVDVCLDIDPTTLTLDWHGFQIEDTWGDLMRSKEKCSFCDLRWKMGDTVKIGLPGLTVSDDQHLALMRGWLKYCDGHHECKPRPDAPLPTRVLDLGTTGDDDTIRLRETQKGDSFHYIALSHCWGKNEHFSTTAFNLQDHMRGIQVARLPKTFQHAVRTSRSLGIRIGPGGDFDKQSAKMEEVFSSAYCVIAASSARGQGDGFLNPRRKCDYVKVVNATDKAGVYVSLFRDDFKEHVLNSPLSERGWVLQERALARRTIYFTEWQTYWECGDGIRCETLTRMDNKLISYLGDPDFPQKLSGTGSNRGEKIRFYEDLYRHYSRLSLTWKKDRPVAIAALEKRLHRDLKSSGKFGVFDDNRSLLPRSLLWQRGEEVPSLTKISFPPETSMRLPTWSWMAYDGGIDFLDLPLGEVDWDVSEIKGNWTKPQMTLDIRHGLGPPQQSTQEAELMAKTRNFKPAMSGTTEFDIIYDIPDQVPRDSASLKCVLVGKLRVNSDVPKEQTTYYVLVIALRQRLLMADMYERVGVGRMLGEYIDLDNWLPRDWVKIK
ncbi:hypothetical protein B0T20DRAFT_460168 [Sordaria brevicollis]|uniref:Protein kinase domain-containing protein n=1 Tax=Sordaria brevicollis TaxID=83679 RepID=A0AAE0PHQ8_SORBR|nr:hypothetical protein B0T20DRAFT_460168 [Sordaria brevicollis]